MAVGASSVTVNTTFLNVRSFGAKGDGISRPLSTIYTTLAAAQVVHPSAASLADELDGVATQTAINYLRDNGGGTLYSQRGTYICNTEILLPKCVLYDSTVASQVNWLGDGFGTKYKWNTDLGTGKWAVRPADGTLGGIGYKCEGVIDSIRFVGPSETYTTGVAPCQMHGVMPGAMRKMYNCAIGFFYAGLCIIGDHSQFINIECYRNYYGIYYENPYSNLYGDFLFEGCQINGCAFAAIGIDYRATGQGTFIKCYIGGGPYGIYKECNGQTTYSAALKGFGNSLFEHCTMEFIGNALISDEAEANGGYPVSYWFGTKFRMINFNWLASLNLPGKAKNAVINMGKGERVEFLGFQETFGWDPGALSTFNIRLSPGFFIEGNIKGLLDRARLGGKPLFAPYADQSLNQIQFHHIGPDWDGWGHGRRCATGQTWIAGDVIADTPGASVIQAIAVTGLYTNGFAGIALEDNDGAANNVRLLVESGGNVPVNADIPSISYTGMSYFVKLSTTVAGKASLAVNITDGPVIGFLWSAVPGTGGNNAVMTINLYNPPLINNPSSLPIRIEAGTSVTLSALVSREGYVRFTAEGAVTYTIPANATTPMPIGVAIRLWSAGAGGVTVSPAATVTLNGTATIAQNTGRVLIQVSADVWDIV